MVRRRACDGCYLRKNRCTGDQPCHNCVRAGFECSYAKKPAKPGPKGPRRGTCLRVNKELQELRDRAASGPGTPPLPGDAGSSSPQDTCLSDNLSSSDPFPSISSGEVLPSAEWESSFSLPEVLAYLEIYHQRMYPVWPVVDRTRLGSMLMKDLNNCETCALAFGICAATIAQLRIDSEGFPTDNTAASQEREKGIVADQFAVEAERYRSLYDYRESTSIEAVLVPLFLHFYYGAEQKIQTASFLLGESVRMCQLLGLDKEDTYQCLDLAEDSYRRRTFWLLYVTERGHAIQQGTNICLTNSIKFSSPGHAGERQLLEAFDNLVGLFTSVEGILLDPKGHGRSQNKQCRKETLSQLQSQLRQHLQWPEKYNEVQRTDIAVTQQWLRILLWQLSLKKTYLSSGSTDESMSLTYPAHVARDALQFVSNVSLGTLVAHGPGMEIKLFEIASTLLDVINCVPSLSQDTSLRSRDILHHLCHRLFTLSNGKAQRLEVLQRKLGDSRISYLPFNPLPLIGDDPSAHSRAHNPTSEDTGEEEEQHE